MTALKQLVVCIAAVISIPAFADVYMGTGADPDWSPLYPTTLSTAAPNAPNYTVIPTANITNPVATSSQPSTFTAPVSPSASSYSQFNYTGMPATPRPNGPPAALPPSPIPATPAYKAATPRVNAPCQQVDMIYGKGPLVPTPCPSAATVLGQRPVIYQVHTGSLKANVERMVAKSGWGQVVWDVPNDYHWIGNVTITSTSIQSALDQLLSQYPVQAVFYDTNRVVNIVPRRSQ
jgi:hypothetical protein